MALIDYNNRFSDAQAVTTSAASDFYIDGRAAGSGVNDQAYLIVETKTAFAGGTSLAISWQTATDSSFTSPVTLFATPAILTASLTKNTVQVRIPIPIGLLRYNRIYYTVSGTMTAGTISAFIQYGVVVEP